MDAKAEGTKEPRDIDLQRIKQVIRDKLQVSLKFSALHGRFFKSKNKELLDLPETINHLQVGRQVWNNVDRKLRTELWMKPIVNSLHVQKYADLLAQEISSESSVDIDKDLARTYPAYRQFACDEGKLALRNVLRAYAALDPEVGYCQGMNFLAGLLLMYLGEAQAFAAFVVLMQDRSLHRFYQRNMSLLQVQLWQLGRLMSPKLCQHMESCGVAPVLYGASWLMTCFSADFPVHFSARILDVLLTDRCDFALLKVAVAILRLCERKLRSMADLEDILSYLKLDVPGWDEHGLNDILVEAFGRPWTPRQLNILNSTEGAESVAQAMERVHGIKTGQTPEAAEQPVVNEGVSQEAAVACQAGGSKDAHCLVPPPSPSTSLGGVPSIPMLKPPPSAICTLGSVGSPMCLTPTSSGRTVVPMMPTSRFQQEAHDTLQAAELACAGEAGAPATQLAQQPEARQVPVEGPRPVDPPGMSQDGQLAACASSSQLQDGQHDVQPVVDVACGQQQTVSSQAQPQAQLADEQRQQQREQKEQQQVSEAWPSEPQASVPGTPVLSQRPESAEAIAAQLVAKYDAAEQSPAMGLMVQRPHAHSSTLKGSLKSALPAPGSKAWAIPNSPSTLIQEFQKAHRRTGHDGVSPGRSPSESPRRIQPQQSPRQLQSQTSVCLSMLSEEVTQEAEDQWGDFAQAGDYSNTYVLRMWGRRQLSRSVPGSFTRTSDEFSTEMARIRATAGASVASDDATGPGAPEARLRSASLPVAENTGKEGDAPAAALDSPFSHSFAAALVAAGGGMPVSRTSSRRASEVEAMSSLNLSPKSSMMGTSLSQPSPRRTSSHTSLNPSQSTSTCISQMELFSSPHLSCHTVLQHESETAPVEDSAISLAGDILRAMTQLDNATAKAQYDPRQKLGEGMYADSPHSDRDRDAECIMQQQQSDGSEDRELEANVQRAVTFDAFPQQHVQEGVAPAPGGQQEAVENLGVDPVLSARVLSPEATMVVTSAASSGEARSVTGQEVAADEPELTFPVLPVPSSLEGASHSQQGCALLFSSQGIAQQPGEAGQTGGNTQASEEVASGTVTGGGMVWPCEAGPAEADTPAAPAATVTVPVLPPPPLPAAGMSLPLPVDHTPPVQFHATLSAPDPVFHVSCPDPDASQTQLHSISAKQLSADTQQGAEPTAATTEASPCADGTTTGASTDSSTTTTQHLQPIDSTSLDSVSSQRHPSTSAASPLMSQWHASASADSATEEEDHPAARFCLLPRPAICVDGIPIFDPKAIMQSDPGGLPPTQPMRSLSRISSISSAGVNPSAAGSNASSCGGAAAAAPGSAGGVATPADQPAGTSATGAAMGHVAVESLLPPPPPPAAPLRTVVSDTAMSVLLAAATLADQAVVSGDGLLPPPPPPAAPLRTCVSDAAAMADAANAAAPPVSLADVIAAGFDELAATAGQAQLAAASLAAGAGSDGGVLPEPCLGAGAEGLELTPIESAANHGVDTSSGSSSIASADRHLGSGDHGQQLHSTARVAPKPPLPSSHACGHAYMGNRGTSLDPPEVGSTLLAGAVGYMGLQRSESGRESSTSNSRRDSCTGTELSGLFSKGVSGDLDEALLSCHLEDDLDLDPSHNSSSSQPLTEDAPFAWQPATHAGRGGELAPQAGHDMSKKDGSFSSVQSDGYGSALEVSGTSTVSFASTIRSAVASSGIVRGPEQQQQQQH